MGGNRAILVGVGDPSSMKGAYSMGCGCGCGKKTPAAPVKKPSKPSDKK
jgi:hypothetical protein